MAFHRSTNQEERKIKYSITPERIVVELPIKYATIQCNDNEKVKRKVIYWTPIDKFKKTKKRT